MPSELSRGAKHICQNYQNKQQQKNNAKKSKEPGNETKSFVGSKNISKFSPETHSH